MVSSERPKDISKACRLLGTSRSAWNYYRKHGRSSQANVITAGDQQAAASPIAVTTSSTPVVILSAQEIKTQVSWLVSQGHQCSDAQLCQWLQGLSSRRPGEGFWKCYYRLRNMGLLINHKRLYRLYRQQGLSLKRSSRRRKLPERLRQPLSVPEHFTHTWSIDFMSDTLANKRTFRSFHVLDDFNRELLFVEHDYSLPASRVLWVLSHLVRRYGAPKRIRMDNGPEFVATLAEQWAESQDIDFHHIEPGRPMQNAYIERLNGSYRRGVLNAHVFADLDEVREVSHEWVEDYNCERPHDSLGGLAPIAYREKFNQGLGQCCVTAPATPSPPLHACPRP